MTEERLLVRKEFIQAAVERIFLNQGIVLAEKIPHRALLKPQTMQPPLAARIDEPIAHQRLQNMPPTGPFMNPEAAPPRTDPVAIVRRVRTPASTLPIAAADATASPQAAPARHILWRAPAHCGRQGTKQVAGIADCLRPASR